MFKQKENLNVEEKDKNAGFVDENGQNLSNQQPVEKKDEPNPNDVDLSKTVEITDVNLKKVEDERKKLLKSVKKQNIIKWITSLVAIGLLVFAWLYFLGNKNFADKPGIKYGWGISLTAVSIGIIVGYYILSKRVNDNLMSDYLKVYYGAVNAYVFGNTRFKDVHGDVAGKIDQNDFNDCLAYKDVSQLSSRNVVNYTIDGKIKAKICDCAAQQSTVKRLVPLFIGKYLIADNTYTGNDEIIIYLTGNSKSLPPNNLENLPKVLNSKKMVIHTNNKNYESVVNAKVRQAIAQLVTNNVLVDCFISITKGKTYIGLGYDDCLMVVPLQNAFSPVPMERYKKDMVTVSDIVVNLNK